MKSLCLRLSATGMFGTVKQTEQWWLFYIAAIPCSEKPNPSGTVPLQYSLFETPCLRLLFQGEDNTNPKRSPPLRFGEPGPRCRPVGAWSRTLTGSAALQSGGAHGGPPRSSSAGLSPDVPSCPRRTAPSRSLPRPPGAEPGPGYRGGGLPREQRQCAPRPSLYPGLSQGPAKQGAWQAALENGSQAR